MSESIDKPVLECIGINQLVGNVISEFVTVFFTNDLWRHAPHLDELLVRRDNMLVKAHHDNAIGRRFESRRKKRKRLVKRDLGLASGRYVTPESLDPEWQAVR